jgi:hypothetical protein
VSGETRSTLLTTMGVGAAVVGMTVAQSLTTVAGPLVLAALVVEGSSTNQSGEGVPEFFQSKFKQDDVPVYVNFLTGPFGIWRALAASRAQGDTDNTVMSSGWGAANASLLISYMKATDPDNPALTETTWVLDNNVANPNGGFGTRYPVFALIGVNPIPTPADPGAVVISTAYEYDINGNAPKYILNPVADLNSLAAYLNRRLTQADLPMPVDADGTIYAPDGVTEITCETTCIETYKDVNGNDVTVRITQVGGVTYVGYETDRLPLVQPLIDYGGEPGEKLADAIEPALTAAVNWGYPDNDPLANPANLERAALIPTRDENKKFVTDFVAGVKVGVDSLTTGTDTIDQDGERVAPQPEPGRRPLLNALRDSGRFSPGATKPVTPSQHPPKPVAISVKSAVDRLSKAFAPKHSDAHQSPEEAGQNQKPAPASQ